MKKPIFLALIALLGLVACQSNNNAPSPISNTTVVDSSTTTHSNPVAVLPAEKTVTDMEYNPKTWEGNWVSKNAWDKLLRERNAADYVFSAVLLIENKQLHVVGPEDSWADINTNEKNAQYGYATNAANALSSYYNGMQKIFLKMFSINADTFICLTSIDKKNQVKTDTLVRYRVPENMLVGKYRNGNEEIEFLPNGKVIWGKYKTCLLATNEQKQDILLLSNRKDILESTGECITAQNGGALFVIKPTAAGFDFYAPTNLTDKDCLDELEFADGYNNFVGELSGLKKKFSIQHE